MLLFSCGFFSQVLFFVYYTFLLFLYSYLKLVSLTFNNLTCQTSWQVSLVMITPSRALFHELFVEMSFPSKYLLLYRQLRIRKHITYRIWIWMQTSGKCLLINENEWLTSSFAVAFTKLNESCGPMKLNDLIWPVNAFNWWNWITPFDCWMLIQRNIRFQTKLNEPEVKMNGFLLKLAGKTYNILRWNTLNPVLSI